MLGHAIGVDFAGAKDDGFLLWPAVFAQQRKQVGAHFGRAQLNEQLVVEVFAGVFVLGQIVCREQQAGFDVSDLGLQDVCFGEGGAVDAGFAFDDFAAAK